jgi:hypothetical protein
MTTMSDWLGHNRHLDLRRAPQEWDGLAFWSVEASDGVRCVLASDADQAEAAARAYLGRRVHIGTIDGPMQFPVLPLAGFCQYLDAVQLLEGDPALPCLRAPDSTPALDAELVFLDAARDPKSSLMSSRGGGRQAYVMADRWERMQAQRLRALRRELTPPTDDDPGPVWEGDRWSA